MRKCKLNNVLWCLLVIGLLNGCSGRRVDSDAPAQQLDEKDQKIENLVSALSRAQSRIEELDAKVSTLTDKLESTRITVDNISGNKPVSTEAVGSARKETSHDSDIITPGETAPAKPSAPVITGAEAKALLQMDTAINSFNRAMKMLKGGKFADAGLAFSHFTETYPEHVLAGSAQFYSGESYFMMKEYKLALNEYGKVVASFGTSPRVASALVRMAHCYEATGAASEAKRTLALANDMFIGNPSLEWPSPLAQASTEKVNKLKSDLNAAPMEPAEEKSEH